jgi:hypothetical protein
VWARIRQLCLPKGATELFAPLGMLGGKTVDAAEPPRIVFESLASCRASDGAADVLKRSLAPTRAPGPGWTVSMHVTRVGASSLRAEGEILRDQGIFVARRTITGATTDCGALARAVGVWAALVLDAELQRAGTPPSVTHAARTAASPAPVGSVDPSSPAKADPSEAPQAHALRAGEARDPARPESSEPAGLRGAASEGAASWLAPPGAEPAPPEQPLFPRHDETRHDETRALELGAGMFLMTGTGGGAVAGPTAFAVIEAAHGLFLRPALAFGESLSSVPPSDVNASTWLDARFDTCLRLPGLYSRHHGMQLDVCGGTDLGTTTIETGTGTRLPYWNVGPSLDMRGELGSSLSAVLRVVAGVNVLRDSFVDLSGAREAPPLAAARLELAFSWDVR